MSEHKTEQEKGIPHQVVHNMVHNNISLIRSWREYLNLTQKEVAKKLGITQATLSQIEAVDAKPRITTLQKLAGALGINVENLK